MCNQSILFSLYVTDKPDAPVELKAVAITFTTIKIRWSASKKDPGRSKVTAYNLTAIPLNGTKKTAQTGNVAITTIALLEYTFSNLQAGTYYRISVAAFNKAGQGKPKQATFQTTRRVKGKITYRNCMRVVSPFRKEL